ncbi:hypothetical protein [Stackebrandtia soli]|uniref:hypothetical protein n=1 Tax=Stackebrandtia soli TaxID=1892856 RepID=UPI0039EC5A10
MTVETRYGTAREPASPMSDPIGIARWGIYTLAAKSDEDRAAALGTLDGITETYFYTDALQDDGRTVIDELLTQAHAGDYTALNRDVELNCGTAADYGVDED